MPTKRVSIAATLTFALLAGAGQAAASPTLLGQTTYSGVSAGEIDVFGSQVYIAGGFGQSSGIAKINASNPNAMTQTNVAGGWGAGVAVDTATGRYGTTNGFGGQFAIFNANDTLFSVTGIVGCGGNVSYGGGRYGVSTQCADRMTIIDANSGATLFTSGPSAVGSSTAYNSATNTFYQDRNPGNSSLVVSPTFSTTTVSGLVEDANGVTNRVYANNGSNTQVLDGTTHAVLATIPVTGTIEEDTLLNRFYISTGTGINIYDGLTNALIDSIVLPGGETFQGMDMEDGSSRLYVLGSGNHLLVYDMTPSGGVPEPATLALLAMGLLGAAVRKRRSL